MCRSISHSDRAVSTCSHTHTPLSTWWIHPCVTAKQWHLWFSSVYSVCNTTLRLSAITLCGTVAMLKFHQPRCFPFRAASCPSERRTLWLTYQSAFSQSFSKEAAEIYSNTFDLSMITNLVASAQLSSYSPCLSRLNCGFAESCVTAQWPTPEAQHQHQQVRGGLQSLEPRNSPEQRRGSTQQTRPKGLHTRIFGNSVSDQKWNVMTWLMTETCAELIVIFDLWWQC